MKRRFTRKKSRPVRRRRTQAVAAARFAWRNRGPLINAARYAGKRFGGKLPDGGGSSKRRKGSGPKTYSTSGFGGNDISRSKRTVGRYPRLKPNRLLKLINVGMSARTEKFQGITNFDTNTGFFSIANRGDTTTGIVTVPMHVYNLIVFKNSDTSTPELGHAYAWSSSLGTASVVREPIFGMDPTGTTSNKGWQSENLRGPSYLGLVGDTMDFANAEKLLHEWTQVKLNLYGARSRPTWFMIDFVQVKNEFANFASAAGSNERFIELINALTGSMTYSNLQSRDTRALSFLKFVKRFRYMIPAENSTDLNTACGKIKEVKLFIKHGRVLNMAPHENRDGLVRLGHAQVDGGDFETNNVVLNTCADAAQMFMIVRAWSPSRREDTTANWAGIGTNYSPIASTVYTAKSVGGGLNDVPSYDMILRQKYSVPS